VQFTFRKGLKTDSKCIRGPAAVASVKTVGFLGTDFPRVRFDLKVAEGDHVASGQTLCIDRHRPDIAFVASAPGRVSRIRLGPRRKLDALEIACEGKSERAFDVGPNDLSGATLRELLLKSGAWTSFRTRPFGDIPDPKSCPHAIFVTVTDTNPLAPDPLAVLAPQIDVFQRGARALLYLTEGPVYICQPDSEPLIFGGDRIQIVKFAGPHPAGLPGTQIHHVMPTSKQRSVWQIGYQDVAAIGHLWDTGQIMSRRIVSVGGATISNPVLIDAPLGARLSDLVQSFRTTDTTRLLSGSVLSGQRSAFLRRHDLQVTVTEPEDFAQSFWQRLLDRNQTTPTGATLPLERFERAFPFDLLPVPIMRALAVGDVETAERLGCLELLEDDMALLSHLCPSGSDYGMLLRRTLDVLAEEQAA